MTFADLKVGARFTFDSTTSRSLAALWPRAVKTSARGFRSVRTRDQRVHYGVLPPGRSSPEVRELRVRTARRGHRR